MATIKIFLASSEELKHERLVIAEQVANMNRKLANRDIMLRLVKWEYLDSSMGAQHKQEDYNDYLVGCDMCFALFWTKVGIYTKREFEKSLKELNSKGNIRQMSVLFKDSMSKSDELNDFERKCTEEYPMLCHTFCDDNTLIDLFNSEVERFLYDNSSLIIEKKEKKDSKSSIQTIRIFLSIDKTLGQERLELTDLIESLNHSLERRNTAILMLAWDSSSNNIISFNEEITKTDLYLNLYYTNFTNDMQIELESAYHSLCEGKNPKKIYVYFKDGEPVPKELQKFRDSFPIKYGHFYCSFSNIDTLKADFLLQFMEYQSKNLGDDKMLEIRNGKVFLEGKEYVNLQNVPFAGNNEEYKLLLKNIEKTRKLLAFTKTDDEEYAEYARDLQDLLKKQEQMEFSLWDTALIITHLITTKCSERLKRAMELFSAGDSKGAQVILNESDIEHDVQYNLHLMQLGKEGEKGIQTNIEELRLKIQMLKSEMKKGWAEDILKLELRILDIRQKVFGEMHEETADSYDEVADTYLTLGKYKEALEYNLNALKIRRAIFGDNHQKTAESYNNVGVTFGELGAFPKALEYELKGLDIKRVISGDNHVATATSLNNIGITYGNLGDYLKELEYELKALEIRQAILGENHLDTAISLNNVGSTYADLGDYSKSLKYHLKALEIRLAILGNNHPDTAQSFNNVGFTYGKLGDYLKELEYKLKALEIRQTILGDNHPYTAQSFNNVGATYGHLGDYLKELEYELKALEIRQAILGENHPNTAISLNNVGSTYADLGDYSKSLKYHLKALEIRLAILGNNHPDTAQSFNNVGATYGDLGDYHSQLKYNLLSLTAFKQIYGEEHSYTIRLYNNVGAAYRGIGEFDRALEYIGKAYELACKVGDDEYRATFLNRLARTYAAKGDVRNALRYFRKSEEEFRRMGNEGEAVVCESEAKKLTMR